jgi:hypothetical protein
MPQYRRRPRSKPQPPIDRIAKGEAGERALQDWLDRSNMPYLFLDQTPLTFPLALRSEIKRPDFLVPIDTLGTVVIDAKAKALIDNHFVIDEYERRTLAGFEARFQFPVWFACFPPESPYHCHLFRNGRLMGPAIGFDPKTASLHIPVSLGLTVQHYTLSFSQAIMRADKMS